MYGGRRVEFENVLHLGFKMAGSGSRSQDQEQGPIATSSVGSVSPPEQGVLSLSPKNKLPAKCKAAGSNSCSRALTEFF